MDVGLDEIIKKKFKKGMPGRKNRSGARNQNGKPRNNRGNVAPTGRIGKGARIVDARTKIIARQRKTIRDAREKLNALHRQQDARMKISSNAGSLGGRLGGGLTSSSNTSLRRTINNPSRHPRPVMDSYPYHRGSSTSAGILGMRAGADRLCRTIDNDIDMMEDDRPSWNSTTLPQLEVRLTRPVPAPAPTFSRSRELRRDESWFKPSLLRREDSIKSRLEPIRHEEGYRIVVSNLQPTVTHEDIKELFEDIGPLLGSRVVRPGTAEVVYRDFKDAIAAVETYHNRQLDGQPMKCLLVKPISSNSKGIVGTKESIVPDLSTVHKALFMK